MSTDQYLRYSDVISRRKLIKTMLSLGLNMAHGFWKTRESFIWLVQKQSRTQPENSLSVGIAIQQPTNFRAAFGMGQEEIGGMFSLLRPSQQVKLENTIEMLGVPQKEFIQGLHFSLDCQVRRCLRRWLRGEYRGDKLLMHWAWRERNDHLQYVHRVWI